jgi:hypothetical protein
MSDDHKMNPSANKGFVSCVLQPDVVLKRNHHEKALDIA